MELSTTDSGGLRKERRRVFNPAFTKCKSPEVKPSKNQVYTSIMHSSLKQSGFLILIGGAEDRKRERGVLKCLVEKTAAKHVIVIPTASSYPQETYRDYIDVFRDLGVSKIECLDIRHKQEADRKDYLEAIEKADLIYFSGGDQVKLARTLRNSQLLNLIHLRFTAGELHIAGTSAGATAAGDPMIYNGNRHGFRKGSVKCAEGFAFIENIVIDTHFLARKRLARLSQFLVSQQYTKGIGLDEDTGIIIYPNLTFEVIGSGMVTVVNSAQVTKSNYNKISDGDTVRLNNLRVGFLPAGNFFSIKKWTILTSESGPQNRSNRTLKEKVA